MHHKLGHAATRLVRLVRGLALPGEPASADPLDVEQELTAQESRLTALGESTPAGTRSPCCGAWPQDVQAPANRPA